ncbi:prefoldin subunit beta [Candidatus Woesearchaeota archaeon]|nr:MAG: prefoldin subunit beta [Candidatus Woesearchaeota archaeon]
MNQDAREQVQRLQLIEQNLQALSGQKQRFQAQLYEIESAMREVDLTEKAYKIIGGIMVATEKDKLKGELSEKQELLKLRIQTLEKQEQQLKERAKKLRESVVEKSKGNS